MSPHLNHLVSFCINMTLGHFPALHRMLNGGMPALEKLDIVATGRELRNLTAMHSQASPRCQMKVYLDFALYPLLAPPFSFP